MRVSPQRPLTAVVVGGVTGGVTLRIHRSFPAKYLVIAAQGRKDCDDRAGFDSRQSNPEHSLAVLPCCTFALVSSITAGETDASTCGEHVYWVSA